MKSVFSLPGVVALFFVTGAGFLLAQDSPKVRGGRGGPGGRERTLLKEFDKDGDARLNREERQAAREEIRKDREEGGGGRGFRQRGPRGGGEAPRPGARVAPADVRLHSRGGLYHPSILRTLFLDFEDGDWEKELTDFYHTDVDVPANLLVDGRMFEGIGVHFRGASSFFTVGEGSKRSLNLALRGAGPGQKFRGYRTLELLNAHRDPTFARSFLYSQIARRYLPASKVNHVKVVVNGENWGIYVNQEQFNKDFLKKQFGTRVGTRFRVPANPRSGRALAYLGDDPQSYRSGYKVLTPKVGEKPWADLVNLCRTLEQTPPERLEEALGPVLNIDGALWHLAIDNVLINNDGYWIRASDFNLYQDPRGRFHTIPHDANETFDRPGGPGLARGTDIAGVGLDPLQGAGDSDRPLLKSLLAVPSLRARYLAHVRTLAEESLDWKKLGPVAEKVRGLLEAEVKADTRKLESFESFQQGFGGDGSGEAGRGLRQPLSLERFVEERRKYLLDHPEVKKPAPRIAGVSHQPIHDGSPATGDPVEVDPVRVSARMAEGLQPEEVYLYYALEKAGPYQRLSMAKGNDGGYAATIPPAPAGTRVRYYLEARSTSQGTTAFLPSRTEAGALRYRVKPKA